MSELVRAATDTEFLPIFNRLCVALREPQDDSGVTQGIYFDALKDLPTVALEAGAAALMKEPGRRFFPTTAEWRSMAELALSQQLRDVLTAVREKPWKHDCEDCEDTGWVRFECTGDTYCGRQRPHAPHTFVKICPCRPTNRTYQRHQVIGRGHAG